MLVFFFKSRNRTPYHGALTHTTQHPLALNPVVNHMLVEKSIKKNQDYKQKLGNYAMTAHFSKLACAAHANFLCFFFL